MKNHNDMNKKKRLLPMGILLTGLISTVVAVISSYFFVSNGLNVSNFDSMSRLNIARKLVDNLTPGLGQLGNVWPPLPHLLMLPFVVFDPLWHSGIAGAILSGVSFVLASILIYLIIGELTKSSVAKFTGVILFISNVNLLLLQSMAMAEVIFIALTLGTMYGLLLWAKKPTKALVPLIAAGGCAAGATLVRYEGYAFALASILAVAIITFMKRRDWRETEGLTVLFGTLAMLGIVLWSLYLWAIFGDPLYWAKIYSHERSIISTDIEAKKTVVDQSTKKVSRSVVLKSADYGLSIAYMSGIPIFIIGVLSLGIYLVTSSMWKNEKPYIIFLPTSIIAFMIFSLARGSIPVNVPWLDWTSFHNFNTTYEFEYNVRYGILLWPMIVIGIAWLVGNLRWFKFLAFGVIVINIATPVYRGAFLIYQLPLKWATGSATSKAEDQATKWFVDNYDGGKILISALKHDPTMFRMNIDYKNFIHEGTGKYWLTSRDHPEVYADWIYMADVSNIHGGLGGEEDSVSKYLRSVATLNINFEERYNDGIIAIYKKRTKTDETLGNHQQVSWAIKSVDTMKLSRDKARDWRVKGDPTTTEIAGYIKQIKKWNANFIAIDTPYDEEFYPYLKLWVDLAHKEGLHVWFRGNWSAWEGWFNYPKNLTREEHIQKTYEFIVNHSDLFEDGDSFTPCPECENGGPGDPRKTGDKIGYNKFLVDLHDISTQAFGYIGKNVTASWFSVNGDIAADILDKETVAALDGILTIDHYVDTETMHNDILSFINKYDAKIMIGEYGAGGENTKGVNPQEYQAQQLERMYETIAAFGDSVIGVNYWVNFVGPTGLLTEDTRQEKLAVKVLSAFFDTPKFTGAVKDEAGMPLSGVIISEGNNTYTTDANGEYSIEIIPKIYTFTFVIDGFETVTMNLDFRKSSSRDHMIMMKKIKVDNIFSFDRFKVFK